MTHTTGASGRKPHPDAAPRRAASPPPTTVRAYDVASTGGRLPHVVCTIVRKPQRGEPREDLLVEIRRTRVKPRSGPADHWAMGATRRSVANHAHSHPGESWKTALECGLFALHSLIRLGSPHE